jgi:oligopeptide/dipeptide ABC transporter ATP-binding protein
MIFQNPGAALNPLFTIGQQIEAVMRQHGKRGSLRDAVRKLLADVGLPDPARIEKAYPHQLSGGMQQRAMIAIALSSEPRLLIADEPTTALDVTIQSQILALLLELRKTRGISIILITHDLGIVAETCDRVVVLYAGKVAETGNVRELFQNPAHPYTQALLRALPYGQTRKQPLRVIGGSVPNGMKPLPGCAFAPRCPFVMEICQQAPPMFALSDDHRAACWLHREGQT